jgi:hypothetical protein
VKTDDIVVMIDVPHDDSKELSSKYKAAMLPTVRQHSLGSRVLLDI